MKLFITILFSIILISVTALHAWNSDSLTNKFNKDVLTEKAPESLIDSVKHSTEIFPILMYDTEIGFGYGAKVFLLNYLNYYESFDLTVFNSTKGERWYRFAFSYPDNERRHGLIYTYAIDFMVDYDKYIENSFFGLGNGSIYDNREHYTKEPLILSLNFSHAFTSRLVVMFGINYRYCRNYNFKGNSKLQILKPELNSSIVRYQSLLLNLRYDSRNSFINPTKGTVLQGEYESTVKSSLTNIYFNRFSTCFQNYTQLNIPHIILASRLQFQTFNNNELPVQILFSAGGGNSLRGFSQDRFIDKTVTLINEELRFVIYRKLGGIAGIDAGRVWEKPNQVSLNNWKFNLVSGLRYNMDNFIVRFDVGFGPETTGFFFNFGHLF